MMKTRNLVPALSKGSDSSTEVIVRFSDTGEEFEIQSVVNEGDKKVITCLKEELIQEIIEEEEAEETELPEESLPEESEETPEDTNNTTD